MTKTGNIKASGRGVRKRAEILFTAAGEMFRSSAGETNIIAIVLIIIVVIALAVIFRNQLIGVVNRLFSRINTSIDDF